MSQVYVNKTIWEITGQVAHVSVAALAMCILGHFVAHGHVIGLAVGVPTAALKEFYFDEKYEDPITRGSSPLDFLMYMAGLIAGLFI